MLACTGLPEDTSPEDTSPEDTSPGARTPDLLRREQLYATTTRFDWDLSGPTPAGAEEIVAGLPHDPGHGLRMQGETVLKWRVDLAASDLDALLVTLLYPQGAEAELQWRDQHQNFSATRSLRQRRGEGRADLDRTLTFELLTHPDWSGHIAELRLRFVFGSAETRILRRLQGQTYSLAPEVLETPQPWMLDLGHSARTAWLTPPEHAVERVFDVPDQGRLLLSYGATAAPTRGINFRISRISATGEAPILFEARLGAGQLDQWHDAQIELDSKEPVRLRFETSADDDNRALPAWSRIDSRPQTHKPRPNIILISIDTLRADRLPLYGYPHNTAPRLTTWAKNSALTFDDTVVQAPWTLPSHASMLSGLDATRHGINHTHTVVPRSQTLLAEWLRDAGYATAAVTGGAFLHPKYGLAQGFDRFDYWPNLGQPDQELATAINRALEWLNTLPQPFFLFLHTFEVHDYLIYRHAAGADQEPPGLWYDQRIRHTDRELGRLLDHLELSGLKDKTVVVVTSDHGEGLEDGPPGHGFLSENNLRVPLVIQLPDGRGAGQHITRQVRSIDLAPTLLELAGVSHAELDGTSLLPLISDPEAPFPELASSYAAKRNLGLALRRGGHWKAIVDNTAWTASNSQHQLFDLRLDPLALRDLAATDLDSHPIDFDPVLQQAAQALANLPGFRLRFTNHGSSEPLFFRLRGRMLGAEAVKAIHLPCDCVTQEQPFQVRIKVPPGANFELHLEEVVNDPLRVEAWSMKLSNAETPRIQHQLNLEKTDQLLTLSFDGSDWQLSAGLETAAESGLTVISHSGLDLSNHAPSAADQELKQKLTALGYLD